MSASIMKPVFLLRPCSFGNKLWSFCEASPWVYVKRIRKELLQCLAFCTNSVNQVEISEQIIVSFRLWYHQNYRKVAATKHLQFVSQVMVLSRVARLPSLTWFAVEMFCLWTNSHCHIFVSYTICSGESQHVMQIFMRYHMFHIRKMLEW